jgi:hypothetical protein
VFLFLSESKLKATITEATHCIKDVKAEELLGKHNVEFSELNNKENFHSCP